MSEERGNEQHVTRLSLLFYSHTHSLGPRKAYQTGVREGERERSLCRRVQDTSRKSGVCVCLERCVRACLPCRASRAKSSDTNDQQTGALLSCTRAFGTLVSARTFISLPLSSYSLFRGSATLSRTSIPGFSVCLSPSPSPFSGFSFEICFPPCMLALAPFTGSFAQPFHRTSCS